MEDIEQTSAGMSGSEARILANKRTLVLGNVLCYNNNGVTIDAVGG